MADGARVEVRVAGPAAADARGPPLVLVHGSNHAAWCFAEKFQPFFAERDVQTISVSLRCQGASEDVPHDGGKVAATLESHAKDLAHILGTLDKPAVLAGHSFAGLIVQEYVCRGSAKGFPPLAGAALLASVPPEGNGPMVSRFLMRSPVASAKITWAFVTKAFERDAGLARDCFFSKDLPEEEVQRYVSLLATSSARRLLDLSALKDELPMPPPPADAPSVLVMGGRDDFVVDEQGVEDTAKAFGVEPVFLPGVAHDLMLDTRWETAAGALYEWYCDL